MATSAERQKQFRQRMKEKGLVPLTAYVPANQAGDIMAVLAQLCADGATLELGPLRDYATGKLISKNSK